MKYQKATFLFTDSNGKNIEDEALMQTGRDILCCVAGDAGFESFEESEQGVIGYVQKGMLDVEALNACMASFPVEGVNISYELSDAEDKNWNAEWESEGFEPIVVGGRCVIHDTVHTDISQENGISAANTSEVLDITIDARQAFGTGNHETTRMIVGRLLDMDLSGKSVLDCGCGTGILSITAAKLGAKKVTGYDIDEWSVRNTEHNCELNNVDTVEVLLGNSSVLDGVKDDFDVVLANINRNILLGDLPAFVRKMKTGASLILSGFYTEDAVLLKEKAASLGLEYESNATEDNWCMLVFKKI